MVKLGRFQYVGWVAETTAGDNPAVANTDYHLAENVQVGLEGDEIDRVGNLGSLDGMAKVTGGVMSTISFTTEIKGGGDTSTAPVDLPLWKASGFATSDSAYSYTMSQDSTPTDTVTIVYWADGLRWILTGCVGTCDLALDAGNIGKVNWTFTGLMRRIPEDATNPTPDYNTTVPPICQAVATFTVGGETDFGITRSITLDMGNEVTTRRSMTGSDAKAFGYEVPQITRRLGTGTMTLEMPSVSAFDWNTKWKDKTKLDVAFVLGTASFNKVTYDWDMVVNSAPTVSDTDGLLMYDISFDLVTDDLSGNDSFSFTYNN